MPGAVPGARVVRSDKFHDENPKTYRAFYEALSEAVRIINADKNAAAVTYIRVEHSHLPLALVQKIVNDPEIEFTISPQRSFVYASELNKFGVCVIAISDRNLG